MPPWPTTDHAGHCQRKIRQTTHLRDVPDQVTVIRERHAFEGRTLAVISSIKRRGVLLVLVVLPNGSRSLIPAAWTDWRDADANASVCDDDDVDDTSSPGKLGDLLQDRVWRVSDYGDDGDNDSGDVNSEREPHAAFDMSSGGRKCQDKVWRVSDYGDDDEITTVAMSTVNDKRAGVPISRRSCFDDGPEEAAAAAGMIASLAGEQLANGSPLLSVRVHEFFRNVQGVWACTNPNCSQAAWQAAWQAALILAILNANPNLVSAIALAPADIAPIC